MTWLRGLLGAGPDLHSYRRLLWIGQCGTAVLLLVSLLASGRFATVLIVTGATLMLVQFVLSRLVAHRSLTQLAELDGSPLAVLMIDLDHFKKLNDTHGHAKGDAVLREVAGQLVGSLRPADVVARYGGEELMVILPNCGLEDARLKAEMLRARIESLGSVHGAPISTSFGVAAIPETAKGANDVVAMADGALYAAKQAGRNTVMVAARRVGKPGKVAKSDLKATLSAVG